MLDDQGFVGRLEQGLLEGDKALAKIDQVHEEEKARLREEHKEKKRAAAAAAAIEHQQNETAVREKEEAEARAKAEADAAARAKARATAEAEAEARATAEVEAGGVAVVTVGGEGGEDVEIGNPHAGGVARASAGTGEDATIDGRSQGSAGTLKIRIPEQGWLARGRVVVPVLPRKELVMRDDARMTVARPKPPVPREVPCRRCEENGLACYVRTQQVCGNCKDLKVRCDPGGGAVGSGVRESAKKRGKKRARSPSVELAEFVQGSSKKPARRPQKVVELPSSGEEEEERREAEDAEDPRDEVVVIFERLARKTEGVARDLRALAAAFLKYDV